MSSGFRNNFDVERSLDVPRVSSERNSVSRLKFQKDKRAIAKDIYFKNEQVI